MNSPWREELQALAEIESSEGGAVTFYFQPSTPRNQAHREEAIMVKDLVKDARRMLERSGNGVRLRSTLDRIAAIGERLYGNASRSKAIFACPERDFWREFDVPGDVRQTALHLNNRFHLRPLAAAVAGAPRATVVVLDRESASISDLSTDGLKLREEIFDEMPRRVKTEGFGGYDGGRIERHIDNEVMRHFKKVADRLQEIRTRGEMTALVVVSRAEVWPEFEPHLHSYVRQALVARIDMDPAAATEEDIRSAAEAQLAERAASEREALVREIVGEAQRDGNGSLGLRRVLTSLERGEVQTVVIGDGFHARAVECRHCGHLDTRLVGSCAVCGQATKELEDIGEALVGHALRRGVEIVYVAADPEFESRGNIGALLRFRADQNKSEKLAV
jgi:peptide subunit release factor 1 (eRF1)